MKLTRLTVGLILLSFFRAEASEMHWQTNWCCQKCGELYNSAAQDEGYYLMSYVMIDRQTPRPKRNCRDGGECQFIPKKIHVRITKDRIDRYKAQKAEREKKKQE